MQVNEPIEILVLEGILATVSFDFRQISEIIRHRVSKGTEISPKICQKCFEDTSSRFAQHVKSNNIVIPPSNKPLVDRLSRMLQFEREVRIRKLEQAKETLAKILRTNGNDGKTLQEDSSPLPIQLNTLKLRRGLPLHMQYVDAANTSAKHLQTISPSVVLSSFSSSMLEPAKPSPLPTPTLTPQETILEEGPTDTQNPPQQQLGGSPSKPVSLVLSSSSTEPSDHMMAEEPPALVPPPPPPLPLQPTTTTRAASEPTAKSSKRSKTKSSNGGSSSNITSSASEPLGRWLEVDDFEDKPDAANTSTSVEPSLPATQEPAQTTDVHMQLDTTQQQQQQLTEPSKQQIAEANGPAVTQPQKPARVDPRISSGRYKRNPSAALVPQPPSTQPPPPPAAVTVGSPSARQSRKRDQEAMSSSSDQTTSSPTEKRAAKHPRVSALKDQSPEKTAPTRSSPRKKAATASPAKKTSTPATDETLQLSSKLEEQPKPEPIILSLPERLGGQKTVTAVGPLEPQEQAERVPLVVRSIGEEQKQQKAEQKLVSPARSSKISEAKVGGSPKRPQVTSSPTRLSDTFEQQKEQPMQISEEEVGGKQSVPSVVAAAVVETMQESPVSQKPSSTSLLQPTPAEKTAEAKEVTPSKDEDIYAIMFKSEDLMKKLRKNLLDFHSVLNRRAEAKIFRTPIKDVPGYGDWVHRPMDLTTIKKKIESGEIRLVMDFWCHVCLMLQNAVVFNPFSTDEHEDAILLRAFARNQLAQYTKTESVHISNFFSKHNANGSSPVPRDVKLMPKASRSKSSSKKAVPGAAAAATQPEQTTTASSSPMDTQPTPVSTSASPSS